MSGSSAPSHGEGSPPRDPTHELPEEHESLWLLAASPTIWAAHFLLAYCTAAIWCAKAASPDQPLGPVRVAIAAYTVAALMGIGLIGWHGWKRYRLGAEDLPHDVDRPEDRHGFLGFATVLLSGLSAVAVLYETLAAVLIETCR